MHNDLISRSTLIGKIEDEIQILENEKERYCKSGNIFNRHIMHEKIKEAKNVIRIIKAS